MAKDFIINTSGLNDWGTRILTSGVDTTQFRKNPVLLYMHRRGFSGDRTMPIGRVENLRVEGDELRGTPVFDTKDEFAAEVARKWDEGFLRMCSAGVEPLDLSSEPEHLLPGQSRPTVVRSKLVEVSIVDIGSNDAALQLYQSDGNILTLAAGVDNEIIPLLKKPEQNTSVSETDNNQNNFQMNKILLTLGLAATASEQDAVNAITKLQENAAKVEKIELARIESAVDIAIKVNKTTADKRDHFIALGKAAGFESLQTTLDMLTPAQRPTDFLGNAGKTPAIELSYSKMTTEQLSDLRDNDRAGYIKLYKAEFGFDPTID